MFCEKCGRPTEGEQTICSSCAAEQLAQTPEAVETPEFDNDTFELNTAGVAPEKKMPKKKGGLIAAIAAIAVVAAVAVGAFLNWDSISAFFGRNFKEPEEYLVDVESAAIADYSAELSGAYGKFLNSYSANQTAAEAEIHLTLGDDLLSLIESALSQQGVTMDLTWLKDIKLSLDANVQDTAMQMNLGIGLGMKDLLNADVIVDAESGKSYIAIPTLNDDYVYIDIPSNIPLDQVTDMLSQSKQMTEELIKALPTEKELDELINTYAGVVLSHIKNVEKGEDTLAVGGVSQKVVVLTARISQADLLDMAEEALKTAKNDKTIKKFMTALSKYVNDSAELSGGYYEPVDLYQEFVDAIPSALESLQELKEQAESGNYLKMNVYVDMENQVRGHMLALYTDGRQGEGSVSWQTVVEGDVTYLKADLGTVQITGEKTEQKGVSEGCYTLNVEGMKLGRVEFENMTENGGTIRFIPSEELLSEVLSESGIPTGLLGENVALELTYSNQGSNRASCEVKVLVNSKTFVGLALSSEASAGGKISIPSNAVNAAKQEAIMQWVKDAKFDALLDNLSKAGVPKDLVDVARSYVEMLQAQLN